MTIGPTAPASPTGDAVETGDAADAARSGPAPVRPPGYVRRNPLTAAYLLVVIVGWIVVGRLLPAATADRFKTAISTNPHNMAHDPVGVLLASPLVSATESGWLSYLCVVGVGVGVCLAALERRIGAWRALAVLVLGNAAATAVATSVAAAAVHSGRYPAEWWDGKDYGISYAVFTVAGAVTPLVARRWRPVWLMILVAYPFADAQWFGDLPNFATIGHLTAIALGVATGRVLLGGAGGGASGRQSEA